MVKNNKRMIDDNIRLVLAMTIIIIVMIILLPFVFLDKNGSSNKLYNFRRMEKWNYIIVKVIVLRKLI